MLTQKDILQLQNTTDQTHSKESTTENEQLIEKIHIEGTGFDIIKIEGKRCFVAIGNYRVTKEQTEAECRQMIKDKDYELLIGLIGAVIQSSHAEDKDITIKEVTRMLQAAGLKEGPMEGSYNIGKAVEIGKLNNQ